MHGNPTTGLKLQIGALSLKKVKNNRKFVIFNNFFFQIKNKNCVGHPSSGSLDVMALSLNMTSDPGAAGLDPRSLRRDVMVSLIDAIRRALVL